MIARLLTQSHFSKKQDFQEYMITRLLFNALKTKVPSIVKYSYQFEYHVISNLMEQKFSGIHEYKSIKQCFNKRSFFLLACKYNHQFEYHVNSNPVAKKLIFLQLYIIIPFIEATKRAETLNCPCPRPNSRIEAFVCGEKK